MKSTIHLSLDQELIDQLRKENNYSDLVNNVVKEYYNGINCENIAILMQNEAKYKKEARVIAKKRRLIAKKIEKIKQKEKKVIKIVKKLVSRDPIRDPIYFLERKLDKQYPKIWAAHLEFLKKQKGGKK